MKVRMNTIIAGPGISGRPGSEIEVSDEQGKELIAGNYAVAVEEGELAGEPAPKPARGPKPPKAPKAPKASLPDEDKNPADPTA